MYLQYVDVYSISLNSNEALLGFLTFLLTQSEYISFAVDYSSDMRVEKTIKLLEKYEVKVNDLYSQAQYPSNFNVKVYKIEKETAFDVFEIIQQIENSLEWFGSCKSTLISAYRDGYQWFWMDYDFKKAFLCTNDSKDLEGISKIGVQIIPEEGVEVITNKKTTQETKQKQTEIRQVHINVKNAREYINAYTLSGWNHQRYTEFLQCMFEYCDSFSMILYRRNEKDRIKSHMRQFLASLDGQRITRKRTEKWPLTEDFSDCIYEMYVYQTTGAGLKILEKMEDIYEIDYPEYPMDISFYKDGICVFGCCAHEELNQLYTNDVNLLERMRAIGFEIIVDEKERIEDLFYPWCKKKDIKNKTR